MKEAERDPSAGLRVPNHQFVALEQLEAEFEKDAELEADGLSEKVEVPLGVAAIDVGKTESDTLAHAERDQWEAVELAELEGDEEKDEEALEAEDAL